MLNLRPTEDMPNRLNLLGLPDEILLNIMVKVPFGSGGIKAMSRTCRKLQKIICTTTFVRSVAIEMTGDALWDCDLKWNHRGYLRMLKVHSQAVNILQELLIETGVAAEFYEWYSKVELRRHFKEGLYHLGMLLQASAFASAHPRYGIAYINERAIPDLVHMRFASVMVFCILRKLGFQKVNNYEYSAYQAVLEWMLMLSGPLCMIHQLGRYTRILLTKGIQPPSHDPQDGCAFTPLDGVVVSVLVHDVFGYVNGELLIDLEKYIVGDVRTREAALKSASVQYGYTAVSLLTSRVNGALLEWSAKGGTEEDTEMPRMQRLWDLTERLRKNQDQVGSQSTTQSQ